MVRSALCCLYSRAIEHFSNWRDRFYSRVLLETCKGPLSPLLR